MVNKETGNKIYNEEYENLDSKALSQQEKLDIISVNKLKGKKGKKNRKLTLNKNYNINLGDVKSKKLYDNYFGQMKNEEDDLSQSLETKEQFKTKFTEKESQDIKISKSEKKKKKKKKNIYEKKEKIKKKKNRI